MKKATKGWLIAALVLILIGAIGFVAVLAANHWDLKSIGNVRFETVTVEIPEAFSNISIDSDTADITFVPSEDGKCKAVFREQEKMKHTASVREGTLTVETKDEREWYDYLSFSFESPKITVYLPQTVYDTLTIGESTGDINIPADFRFKEVRISASTGDVFCAASVSGLLEATTSTGDIRIQNGSVGELKLTVSTGEVEIGSVTCAGNAAITVSTGDAILRDVSVKSLHSKGSTGDIAMTNVIAAEQISIEWSTGDVRFEQCDAAELSIDTNTGDVTGSLRSDKVFIAHSDTGDVRVPEMTSGGKCKITTNTGDIRITVG